MMKNRIEQRFGQLRKTRKKAFVAFVTAGDPSLKMTERLVLAFEKSGVDIVELGVPFSDPLADGPTIQASSQRALKNGVTLEKIFSAVKNIRKKSQMPIVLMTYYNPVFHFGESRFIAKAKDAGVDGVIIPDLPPEEAGGLIKAARPKGISTVFFLSPTTTAKRIRRITAVSTGFIYYVSLTGVTGARQSLAPDILRHIRAAKKLTDKPVCVGFGISTGRQVRALSRVADGVIVGSAIVSKIADNRGKKGLVQNVAKFVSNLTKNL